MNYYFHINVFCKFYKLNLYNSNFIYSSEYIKYILSYYIKEKSIYEIMIFNIIPIYIYIKSFLMKLYSKKLYTYIYLNYLIKFIIYLSKETWNFFFFFFNRKKKKN